MLKYFWTYKTDLPEGVGTPSFGPTHIAWLLTVLFIIVISVLIYRRQSEAVRQRVQRVLIVIAAILEVSRWVWAAIIGHYNVIEMLPLHLCSLSIWMEFAAVFTKRDFLKEFGYALCMTGALAALLTPDWSIYPFLSFQYLHSVIVHALLLLIPVLWVWGDGFRPNFRRLPKCFLILIVFSAPIFALNFVLKSNYLFLRFAPKDTPLELFETQFGNPGYLIPLFMLILVIWLIFYLPWVILEASSKKVVQEPGQL